jgi:zeaxanthin glucosyltransferase
MTHFGVICLGATGHLNTVFPLGKELQRRGHQVTIFSSLVAQAKAQTTGFDFCEIYSFSNKNTKHSKPFSRLADIQQTFQQFAKIAENRLQNAPKLIKERGVEALLIDLSVFEGGTIADYLNLPYITICCLLPLYQDPLVPPIATTWQYNSAWWAKLRNRSAYSLFNRIAQPVWQVIYRYRQKWNLPAYKHTNDIFSKLAIATRHIQEFEFPRQLPPHFHFTGPFHHALERPPVEFPFEKLSNQPLIYASMGTLQNKSDRIFRIIAEACQDLEAQLVISLGGGLDPTALPSLPGNPLVVKYAPQLELLQKASLNINHAGLNTALESLSYGVPMVAIPITDDQPGIAARIAWTGVGEFLSSSRLSASKLRTVIQKVL